MSDTGKFIAEHSEAKTPSPSLLKAIANDLVVSCDEVIRATGYIDSTSLSLFITARIPGTVDLTNDEIEEVRNFIGFLRAKCK